MLGWKSKSVINNSGNTIFNLDFKNSWHGIIQAYHIPWFLCLVDGSHNKSHFYRGKWFKSFTLIATIIVEGEKRMWFGLGSSYVWWVDHTSQFRHHPSSYLTVIVWNMMGQHLCLKIAPSNFTTGTRRKVWCDRGMSFCELVWALQLHQLHAPPSQRIPFSR